MGKHVIVSDKTVKKRLFCGVFLVTHARKFQNVLYYIT